MWAGLGYVVLGGGGGGGGLTEGGGQKGVLVCEMPVLGLCGKV